ncbi:hypothetical protein N0V90_006842 [Kalmusia sp. IMI 367209]|nr:hypothetical protein N0V90_006842 [Kalmusia sp. IMI 367209]
MDIKSILSSPQKVVRKSNPPIASSNESQAQHLSNAIDSATPDRLRAVLHKVSAEIPGAFAAISNELLLKPGALKRAAPWADHSAGDEEDPGHEEDSDYSDEEPNAGPARKRRQRYEICGQCDKEYDVLLNGKTECRWHDGDLEVDYDGGFWDDHDENCHGGTVAIG